MTASPHDPGADEQELPAVADSQQQCVVAEVLHEDGTLVWGVALVKAQQVLDRLAALKPAPGTDSSGLAVQRVEDVHEPYNDDGAMYCGWTGDGGTYRGCGHAWPCPTMRGRAQQ